MYASHGLFQEAFEVLEKLPNHDVVTWNVLIAAFVEHGCNEEGLDCLEQMQCEPISPDAVTFICSLKACCNMGATEKGRELHAEITKQGLPGADVSIANTLIGMYSKFGLLAEAKQVFDSSVVKSVVAWNAIIAAYTEQGHGEAALLCFEKMEPQGASPDLITVVCSIKACGSIGARGRGRELHLYVSCKGLEVEPLVGNTLVFMYAKCGLLATAQKVFNGLDDHNVVSWTVLLAGYAQLGETDNVFQIFEGMIREDVTPDVMTYGSVLSACSYSGLVDEGQMLFEIMHNDRNSFPSPWHHVCMIDLLGRAGQVEKAVMLTREMPFHPCSLAWHIVLGACKKWGLAVLGNLGFEHAFELDDEDAPAYVCIGNIYRDAALLEDANDLEAMIGE
ncbi:hypothetical protein GOP47_0001138 [Adiantum capillus-veneris]|uniref:Pentatricopeptide repeat-containing protein n=1 Tax=Adiantum capillus-veneris TaxID=13818 RepID=A0A9D4ZR73_ADICA|nr:hypothetical protein GOP47_0001138 [Adiantum capillus-veneris]